MRLVKLTAVHHITDSMSAVVAVAAVRFLILRIVPPLEECLQTSTAKKLTPSEGGGALHIEAAAHIHTTAHKVTAKIFLHRCLE